VTISSPSNRATGHISRHRQVTHSTRAPPNPPAACYPHRKDAARRTAALVDRPFCQKVQSIVDFSPVQCVALNTKCIVVSLPKTLFSQHTHTHSGWVFGAIIPNGGIYENYISMCYSICVCVLMMVRQREKTKTNTKKKQKSILSKDKKRLELFHSSQAHTRIPARAYCSACCADRDKSSASSSAKSPHAFPSTHGVSINTMDAEPDC